MSIFTIISAHAISALQWLHGDMLGFKAAILGKFNAVLPADQAALLGGEMLGGTDGMSAELKNAMSASGTSYVTSMYGYKIFVIVATIEALFANWIPRRARFFVTLVIVGLFIAMAGGSLSVIRGAIMGTLGLIAKQTGRIFNAGNALIFTAGIMLIFDPALITQAVFLLSFLSVLGIIYLSKPLNNLFGWSEGEDRGILDWHEGVIMAVASLLPIIPVITASFGDFSLSAFPSNILIFLAIPATMFFGALIALSGFISYYLSFFIAKLASVILIYQLAVIKVFAAIVVPLPSAFDSVVVCIIYYLSLIIFILASSSRRRGPMLPK